MPEPSRADDETEFNPAVMNETWDMSNSAFQSLLEKQRQIEIERAIRRAADRKKRGVWRKIVDTLIPA